MTSWIGKAALQLLIQELTRCFIKSKPIQSSGRRKKKWIVVVSLNGPLHISMNIWRHDIGSPLLRGSSLGGGKSRIKLYYSAALETLPPITRYQVSLACRLKVAADHRFVWYRSSTPSLPQELTFWDIESTNDNWHEEHRHRDWLNGWERFYCWKRCLSVSVLGFRSFYDNFINPTDKAERIYPDIETSQLMIIRVILIGRSRPLILFYRFNILNIKI